MHQHMATGVTHRQQQVGQAAAALTVLNPLATLARGYAVVRDPETRRVLTRGEQIRPDDSIEIQMNDANLNCRVESVESMDPS
jgi:exodeoxyribonuclease VII large subunit